MRWLVRADASVTIGAGHVARCTTLARQARLHGVHVEFVCRELDGSLLPQLRAEGFTTHAIGPHEDDAAAIQAMAATAPVNWLVVDHYGLDARWERVVQGSVMNILVIDDLANRPHDCSVLLDQNFWPDAHERYKGLLPADCLQLLGPRYLLLREEFAQARATLKREFGTVRRLLLNFGGADEPNVTCMALDALLALGLADVAVDVVIGAGNPHQAAVQQRLQRMAQAQLHVQTSRMAQLIARADLAVGACGSSTWERCFLGLPTVAVVLAENQRLAAGQLDQQGVLANAGDIHAGTPAALRSLIAGLMGDPARRAAMSRHAMDIMPPAITDLAGILIEREKPSC